MIPRPRWLGRVLRPGIGPRVVTIREGRMLDITNGATTIVRDIVDLNDPVEYLRTVDGENIGVFDQANEDNSWSLLGPCDLTLSRSLGST